MALCINSSCQFPGGLSSTAGPNPQANSNSVEIGDILAICAAAELPLFKQIKDDQSLKSKVTQVFASSEYSRMVQNTLSNPPIPCIVVSLPSPAKDDRLMVCVMREITENEISELATMVQHFLLPVHRDRFNLADHLHTSPEWTSGTSQWVITAFPIEAPEGSLRGHFQNEEVARYCIGKRAVRSLLALSLDRRTQWMQKPRPERRAAAEQMRLLYSSQLGEPTSSNPLSSEIGNVKKQAKPKKAPTNAYLVDNLTIRNKASGDGSNVM
ncbi:hypothetical protein HWV62_16964 [Athelia sp. TMB]|nr:hypothetical protein HWV62_16964 [Athelia sp. TMB]